MADKQRSTRRKQPKDTKSITFDSDLKPVAPHIIIFEIIRQAIRNGAMFEVDTSNNVHPCIGYSLSIGEDIDEYIERLNK